MSYPMYANTANQLKHTNLVAHFEQVFSQPAAIAFEVAMVLALIGFVKIP